jgi:hypothetical protein
MSKFIILIDGFYGVTTRDQMKNRWDSLKRMFTQWKTLNERATGLGRDPHTGSISAPDEWWAKQNEVSRSFFSRLTIVLAISN